MNPHYQRVLEADRQLVPPVRWLTRAMSSWWLILGLGLFVVLYAAAAFVPLGGRYLWQSPMIDAVRAEVLSWWPLRAAMVLLSAAVVWSAFRRLPWRLANLGVFIAAVGLAVTLVSLSIAWANHTAGVAAVPITIGSPGQPTDATRLTYTTRYGSTAERVVVVMLGDNAPMSIPVPGLPRWHDAGEQTMPRLSLHDDPKLAAVLAFRARVTTVAYIADGELKTNTDGSQTPTPTPTGSRDITRTPYPADALLALRFEVDGEDGATHETTVWLPFEPEGADTLVTRRFYDVQGLGTVGLGFRPASMKLPFALAASHERGHLKMERDYDLYIADSDATGRLLQPSMYRIDWLSRRVRYQTVTEGDHVEPYILGWLDHTYADDYGLVAVTTRPAKPFVYGGLATLGLGLLLILFVVISARLRSTKQETLPAADAPT